ncbi:hypothetical protein [Aeromonas dhakensis]|uniref:hypothetical protein n=1 Tax=Aeromonas dhakensis TaxID=196024 RepID=UPI00244A25FC|nr:hypothetical protein [Aeromonas dhakensis]MDH0348122.1 hypothetical protein [Aeromonas dhakensis]
MNKQNRRGGFKAALLLAGLVLPGCKPEANMPMYEQAVTPARAGAFPNNRFKVERVGLFKDDLAYDGRRGIYIITDTQTGQELVGLSGIGISELGSHKSGKAHHSDER